MNETQTVPKNGTHAPVAPTTVNSVVANISSRSLNSELEQAYETNSVFASNSPILASFESTRNDSVMRLMFVQRRPELTRNTAGSTHNAITASAMNWTRSERVLRTWLNVDKSIVERLNISHGMSLDDFISNLNSINPIAGYSNQPTKIVLVEDRTPETWTEGGQPKQQSPVINPDTEQPVLSDGMPFYAHTHIGFSTEQDITLAPDVTQTAA